MGLQSVPDGLQSLVPNDLAGGPLFSALRCNILFRMSEAMPHLEGRAEDKQ